MASTSTNTNVDDEEPYDFNFCLPVRTLENDRVKLTPFNVSPLHCTRAASPPLRRTRTRTSTLAQARLPARGHRPLSACAPRAQETKGRHTALLSVCWDDWEQTDVAVYVSDG